jgi:DNA polymerase-4
MRSTASIMHLDLDAFFASVEQRDKPSLRGRPVIVGGTGQRGVVATASYEARVHGVRSAMRTAEARARCPHAAFLGGRFDAYREASRLVMERLREESELIEPLSLDEAFVDLAAGDEGLAGEVEQVVARIRADITEITGGLTASVGVASSKLMAKIASEINKPDGVFVVEPGTEADVLGPMQATAIPGVGPATAERLRRVGILTVDEVRRQSRRGARCTVCPGPTTTGRWSRPARPSPSASRTPSSATSPTGCSWSRSSSGWPAPCRRGCARAGCRVAP